MRAEVVKRAYGTGLVAESLAAGLAAVIRYPSPRSPAMRRLRREGSGRAPAAGVLAASVGLIRSETAPDLRTLTATGASTTTRRTITAATAAALGLLGAVLGMAFAVAAALVWAHASLSALFGDVPLADLLILLAGLPLVAAAGGWLFTRREPSAIARQPIE